MKKRSVTKIQVGDKDAAASSGCSCNTKKVLRRRLPIIAWLPLYTWNKLLQDTLAGLTVGLTAIPQGIANAVVADLPAQYGLYSGFMGCYVYLFLGSTKDITIGPTAIMALMIQQHVENLGTDIAVLLCLLSGCVITLLGLLQLGFMVDFISMPVTSGFTSAAAIIIAAAQIKALFGISGASNDFLSSIMAVIKNISETRLWDTLLGVISIALLIGLKSLPGNRRGNRWQVSMWLLSLGRNAIVVALGTLLAYLFYIFGLKPFQLTGEIDQGWPPFSVPPFSITYSNQTHTFLELVNQVGTGLISIPLIAILEHVAIAKAFAEGKSVDATQEMVALGVSNIFGSFFRSMPVTGSFTRTAVNNASGVRTPMGGVVTGLLVLLACGLLTSTFEFIPKSVLAAVIIVAMYYMLEFHIFAVLWRTKKIDVVPLAVTLICCLFISLEYGMIIGILTNLALLLYSTARPGVEFEERLVSGYPVLLVTPKQSINFPAAEYIREEVMSWCDKRNSSNPVILNGEYVHRIDTTVAKNMQLLQSNLEARKQKLIFWNWSESTRGILRGFDRTLANYFRNSDSLEEIHSEGSFISNGENDQETV